MATPKAQYQLLDITQGFYGDEHHGNDRDEDENGVWY